MKNMSLIQIAKACSGQLSGEDSVGKEISGVVIDSRQVEKDNLFIATAGERVDGYNYIDSAFDRGALAVVCERIPVDPKGPYIIVENSLTALKDIARWYRMQLSAKIIGITGSVGKTSTKEFISSVLSQRYSVLRTEGNFNNEVGLPLTILKIREEHEVAVLEMGISHFGEMHRLSEIAKPDIAVITNIGQCHLENLGSRQGVLKAKTEIFDFMGEAAKVIINGDDDMLTTIKEVKGHPPYRFGMEKCSFQADAEHNANGVYASDIITKGLFGSVCDIHIKDKVFRADIPLPGTHMIRNALAGAFVGALLSLTLEEIAAGIASVKPLGGRSNIIRTDRFTIIDDCYNANPVSMKTAIDLLCMADTGRAAILGDMGELGEGEKDLHRKIGAYAASSNLDSLIFVGSLSEYMAEGASETLRIRQEEACPSSYPKIYYYKTRDELIDALPHILHDFDTVLVKASHSMGFDSIVKALFY